MNNFNVSVIIPAYNEETRIERAIQSVLKQSFPVKEIIIVDDGSSDNTSEVVKKYSNFVKYIKQPNQGASSARNTGIKSSTHDWIAFLDADDEWRLEHILNAYDVLKRNNFEIIWYCAAFILGEIDGKRKYSFHIKDKMVSKGVINNYFVTQAKTNFSNSSSMIIKKSIFEQTGLFNIGMRFGEDLDMWYRIALIHPKIAYSNSPGCVYWRREGSITTKEKTVDIKRFLNRIDDTLTSSINLNVPKTKESDFLIQTWVINAIKWAIKQQDNQSLQIIMEKYRWIIPWQWKLIGIFFKNPIFMNFVNSGIKIRTHGNK